MNEEMKNIGEQPSCAEVHAVATGFEEGTEMQAGSPLGKFKDANKLLDAYNELQSEFTRKCQKLSDAEKKITELSLSNDSREVEEDGLKKFAWKNKVEEFLEKHNNANELVEEISNEIANDEILAESDDCLEKAYYKVIEKKFIPHNQLVNDKEFLEKYIYSNDQIKNKIIEDYVSALQNHKSPIVVTNDGFSRGIATSNKFGSLEEASKYVENMFKF